MADQLLPSDRKRRSVDPIVGTETLLNIHDICTNRSVSVYVCRMLAGRSIEQKEGVQRISNDKEYNTLIHATS